MKESEFNRRFRRELEAAREGLHIYRVESHSTEPGMPDNFFVLAPRGMTGWVEMKAEPTVPKRIKYEKRQPAWLMSYWARGGACSTCLYVESIDTVFLIPGCSSARASADLAGEVPGIISFDLGEEGAWEGIARWLLEGRMGRGLREPLEEMPLGG